MDGEQTAPVAPFPVPNRQDVPLARKRKRKAWIALAAAALAAASPAALWYGLPSTRPFLLGAKDAAIPVLLAARGTASDAIAALKARFAEDPLTKVTALPPRGVRVMTVRVAPGIEERAFTGSVAARYETPLAFRVGGKIVERLVEVGSTVAAGQPLLRLDPTDFEAALRAAQANLSAAEAQKRQANSEEARQSRLLKQGWSTRAVYDRVLAASVASDDAVKAAAEQVKLAQNQLSYAVLAAPQDGIVTELPAEAGQVIAAGQPAIQVARAEEREAVIAIPEGQIDGLADWTASATLWGREEAPLLAALRELAPQADPLSRTYRARFTLGAAGRKADLGATVTLHLSRQTQAASATLPTSAVFFRDKQAHVWIAHAAGDRAVSKPVEILSLGSDLSKVAGLSNGDRVITLGVHRIDEALPIRIVETMATAALPQGKQP
jgi:membrane fusion protein, multidrug efflux system